MFLLVFFFFKQKTAYEMRISDWSSDVCSSDLPIGSVAEWSVGHCRSYHAPQDFHWVVRTPLRRQSHGNAGLAPAIGVMRNPPLTASACHERRWAYGLFRRVPALGARPLGIPILHFLMYRSEARRVGKECVRTCRSRWTP